MVFQIDYVITLNGEEIPRRDAIEANNEDSAVEQFLWRHPKFSRTSILKLAAKTIKQRKPWRSFNPLLPTMYSYMGWCAADSEFWMPTSVPETQFQNAWEEIEDTQKTEPTGITKKSEGSIGVCYDIVGTKPPCDLDRLGTALGVTFHNFFSNINTKLVLLHGARKAWFFHFLRHGFKDGKGPQNLAAIRETVPLEYQYHFDLGTRGEINL